MCRILGVDAPELARLNSQGVAVKLSRDCWDVAETARLYVEKLRARASTRAVPAELAGERARLARAQADKAEMQAAQLRGELVEADAVERQWQDVLRQVRAGVLAVPSRLRQSLDVSGALADAMDRELRAVLTELGGHGDR
jgi:phage terminase Nu1 subunit (DNA packaging protein)